MLVLQLFQHIRIGGVTGFGLLHWRQTQLFEQKLSQLLGRIDIEFLIRIGENDLLTGSNPLGKHVPKLLQLGSVNGYSPLFHAVQNRTQRQFDIFVERYHAVLLQFFRQDIPQIPNRFRTGCGVLILHTCSQEIGSQLGHGIVGLGGVQIVGRQSSVKDTISNMDSQLIQAVHGRFTVVEDQFLPRQVDRLHLHLHRR